VLSFGSESNVSYQKGTDMNTPQAFTRPWTVVALLALLGCLTPVVLGGDASPRWQPMLAKSFQGEVKDIGVTSLVVYRNPGCVFLQVDGKVYCSAAGASNFKLVNETWEEVCSHAKKANNPKHVFVLTDTCIKESTDGGTTWKRAIDLPRNFVPNSDSWVQYDATNDVVYLMKKGSDLYKLARR
jgi:hypothetical protein